jgi:hypothetical protein
MYTFGKPSAITGAAEATTSATARMSFFMGVLLRAYWLAVGAVGVREAFGHHGGGGGDDQGNGDNELLHESSPLGFGRLISGSAGWPRVPFEQY